MSNVPVDSWYPDAKIVKASRRKNRHIRDINPYGLVETGMPRVSESTCDVARVFYLVLFTSHWPPWSLSYYCGLLLQEAESWMFGV